ncbi:MAG TPA: glycoside hydrolase family 3 N-terminal domain-containing protein [Ferruginibacter sp.]|nr:glycoside hydrolase family 3 N-terminal domain-containing protein [Ferruginibacter sp.]
MKRYIFAFLLLVLCSQSFSQNRSSMKNAQAWVDNTYNSLSDSERIAQLMVVRLSTIESKTKTITFYDSLVTELVKKYNVGGICLFQGNPVKQANIINSLQAIAKTPVLICIDAEWGVGMRMTDSVLSLPHQMMLGAMSNAGIVYQYGKIVAEQCKRIGVQVNYAPVVDVNNNPNNPVINDRSFGEDKYKVALFGTKYMQGMQDMGVMACAKHFPGHGDVTVDSHFDLPVINKSMKQLDSLELYPFRTVFDAGIGSVMTAHLFIPAIDTTTDRATSLSKNSVTGLMRDSLGYNGLSFTDALEMQGVKKYYPAGAAAVQALIAGNDMLCLPEDIPTAINKIQEAIKDSLITWDEIEMHCKKVLMVKYQYGLTKLKPINTKNLTADLNSKVNAMTQLVATNAITLVKKTGNHFFPLQIPSRLPVTVAYVGIGIDSATVFANRMKKDYNADLFYFPYTQDSTKTDSLIATIKQNYLKVVISIHNYNRTPANNFGISKPANDFISLLQQQADNITFVFGNPYAIKNWCGAPNIVACYEDDSIIENTAADMLQGKMYYAGKLPVTVCPDLKFGTGIITTPQTLPTVSPDLVGLDTAKLYKIDSIANAAIAAGATPGCVVLVAKDGKIAYQKAFGHFNYDKEELVTISSVYDLASVTKICATTLAVMKLYEDGKININKTVGDYLPWTKGTDKQKLLIKNILTHQAGLVPYIDFYKETIDSATGVPDSNYYARKQNDSEGIRVAENLYLRNDWRDTMYKRILKSPLTESGKYVYSDNDFIFLAKIVETITGKTLDEYVKTTFYQPLGLTTIGFKPREYLPLDQIAPTEDEKKFRRQLIRGDVHDPGAAMFGGVAGHAGVFSDAYDLAVIMQMLLNDGTFNGVKYLDKKTITLFTAYQGTDSRRGFGFDKPEKDNATRPDPYPCRSASPATFGHTGFTGTCVWVDPTSKLIYIFLSNRVTPQGADNKKLLKMNVRTQIQEAIYQAIDKDTQ